MSLQITAQETDYPESDGKPMGETELHQFWMFRIMDLLRYRYREQRVYVAGNLLVYYEEGVPYKFVVPDAFLVKDCEPRIRRTYRIWEEGKCPKVVFEVTSKGTQREDTVVKLPLYDRLGVEELFLYDPTGDYLKSPLVGYRRGPKGLEPLTPDASGALTSGELGVVLRVENEQLVMYDAESGHLLLTRAEAGESRADSEKSRADAEKARADAAELRAEALEEQLERLRRQSNPSGDR